MTVFARQLTFITGPKGSLLTGFGDGKASPFAKIAIIPAIVDGRRRLILGPRRNPVQHRHGLLRAYPVVTHTHYI